MIGSVSGWLSPIRLWLVWLVVGHAVVAGYFLIPVGLGREIAYDLIGLAAAIVIVFAVRMHRPAQRRMWLWIAGGVAMWVFGDVTWSVYAYVLEQEPFPSLADAFYLCAYPMLVAGLLHLVRGRKRDIAGLLDAGIVATGLGLVIWSLVMRPIAADDSMELFARLISLAYPAADVLLLAMLVRMLSAPGARTASFRLMVTAMVLLLGADMGYSLVTTFSEYESGVIDAGWLLGYVCWAAAALHPSMRTLTNQPAARPIRFTRRRLVLLAISSLLAPIILVTQGTLISQGMFGVKHVDWLAIGLGAIVLFLLVVARMSGLTAQVQRQADQLSTLAMRDELTGMPNRRLLEQRIRASMHRPIQVAIVDLDDFKAINDRLGHTVGDQVVVAVGRRLAAALRPSDTVARLGGDEFAILLPDTDAVTADAITDDLLRVLGEPVTAGHQQLLTQASIGIADAAGTTDPLETLRRADVAMYAAKAEGGNRYLRFRTDLDERTAEYARLGARLREALDAGQFQLVYQPIVDLPNGRIVAVETLLRWRHPNLGIVSPLEFVPVAENNGLIVPLGAWILREACTQAATWLERLGPLAPRRVSVNVSARQLAEPDFPEVVAAVLAETGLPPEMLTVEVTETAVFNDDRALEALNAIHRLGVRIALDDFGTGHSSLGLLQTCPVDILKVDKTFVDHITMAGRHAVIATALIELCNGLNLVAVAEGVETAEQAEALYRLGYHYAQGFHFGRPVPAAEISVMVGEVTAGSPR